MALCLLYVRVRIYRLFFSSSSHDEEKDKVEKHEDAEAPSEPFNLPQGKTMKKKVRRKKQREVR